MLRRVVAAVCFIIALNGYEAAKAQIVTTPNIDQLCKSASKLTYRKTIVYVDLAAVRISKLDWGLTILNRLELAPREPIVILAVNPNNFEITEVFDSCLPTYTTAEVEDARKSRGLWDKLVSPDPADQQRENLQTFDARLRNALDRVISESKKYQDGQRQDILGAIAFDKNRYLDQNTFYRVIVYTDGTIKEPGGDSSSSGESQLQDILGKRYAVNFSGAKITVFGINAQDDALQTKEQIFSAFFLKNWGQLDSFASSLSQQGQYLYPPALRMDGSFEGGGTEGSAKFALFSPKEGNFADGWFAFNTGRETLYVPFQGEYHCAAEECRLVATCSQTVPPESSSPYFRKGDRVLLTGGPSHSFEGSLQADSPEVFKDEKQKVKYALKFSAK